MNIFRKKSFILITLLAFIFTFFELPKLNAKVMETTKVKLQGGTVVALSLENSINSDMPAGTPIDFRVIRDVTVDDIVVIRSGSIASGTISDSKSNGALGRAGKITINLNSVTALDGQEIFLRGNLDKEGKDQVAASVILGLICLPFFLISGEDAKVPAGTELRAYVEQDYQINVEKIVSND